MRCRAFLRSIVCLALSCTLVSTDARFIPHLTFGEHGFKDVDALGQRVVSDGFYTGGHAEVKKNFIRLTTDRQSKRGYVWSKGTVDNDHLMTVLAFRIHGQGQRWFGDGIGFWITHEKQYAPGDNHAFTDKFYGVGIVLDTFKNEEHKGGHKDVTVQINDGTKTLDKLTDETKIGCDAMLRHHSKSDSFNPVFAASRLRVKVNGNHLEVDVDANSEGHWTSCYTGTLPFSGDWLRRATIGITASTGSLADNHDVLKLQSFDDLNDDRMSMTDIETWAHRYSSDVEELLKKSATECDTDCRVLALTKIISNFHVEIEHWMEELKEIMENTVTKLKKKEAQNHEKIARLTERVHTMMENKIGEKVVNVKESVHAKVSSKVKGEIVGASSSWRMPFFFLIIALAGGFGFAYQKYQKLVKSHLI